MRSLCGIVPLEVTLSYLQRDPGVPDVHHLLVPHQGPVTAESADDGITTALDDQGVVFGALAEAQNHRGETPPQLNSVKLIQRNTEMVHAVHAY